MEARRPHPLALVFAAAVVAPTCAASSASAQVAERESRTFVVPPPSETSTGGEPTAPVAPLQGAPRLRGFKLETRDAMHPDEIVLVGLEQAEKPYRPDLSFRRTALGGAAKPEDRDESELYRRQLAIYSGEPAEDPPDETPDVPVRSDGPAPEGASDAPDSWFRPWHVAAFALFGVGAFLAWRRWARPR